MSPTTPDPELRRVEFQVCELCLGGAGGECHVPGCVFWMCDAPTGHFLMWLVASEKLTAAASGGEDPPYAATRLGQAVEDPEGQRLRSVIAKAVAELVAEHVPQWTTPEAEAASKKPIGCVICWPSDGSWPCTSRMIADDLRAAVKGDDPEGQWPVVEGRER